MPDPAPAKPRKWPVQVRSTQTVEAIFEAAIQVLSRDGFPALTTTRVAERAGVSVGTLYQYFSDRRALVAAVLARHLEAVAAAVEAVCAAPPPVRLEPFARRLCDAFLTAKLDHAEVSAALYAPAASLDGQAVVRRVGKRAQAAVAVALGTCADRLFADPPTVSLVLLSALVGPVQAVQAVLEAGAPPA